MSSLFSLRCPRFGKLPVTARGDTLPLRGRSERHTRAFESPLPVGILLVKTLPGFWFSYLVGEVGAAGTREPVFIFLIYIPFFLGDGGWTL